jgi:hypothetical protein
MSIQAARITIDGDKLYQNVTIYHGEELNNYLNFFEDSDFAFRTHQGLFTLPYYNVTLIQLDTVPRKLGRDGIKLVRLTLSSDISFHNPILIPMQHYAKYKIPLIFPEADQFAFCDIQGTWISSDYQVALVQHE